MAEEPYYCPKHGLPYPNIRSEYHTEECAMCKHEAIVAIIEEKDVEIERLRAALKQADDDFAWLDGMFASDQPIIRESRERIRIALQEEA